MTVHGSLAALVVDRANTFADKTLLVDGERRLSFADAGSWMTAFAEQLRALGVGPGDRVCVLLPNSIETAVAFFAISAAGGVIVPLNIRMRPEEIRDVLETLQPAAVIAALHFMTNPIEDRLRTALADAGMSDKVPVVMVGGGLRDPLTYEMTGPPEAGRGLDRDPAPPAEELICFWTSGTTGKPKGVVHGPELLGNVANWTALLGYDADDVVLATRPFYYISGSCWALFGSLLRGCTLVLNPTLTAEESLRLLVAEKVTVMLGGPSVYLQLMALEELPHARPYLALQKGFFGGETIRSGFVERVRAELGVTRLVQTYGMTELQGFAASTVPGDPTEVVEECVGFPLPGFEFTLRDDHGREISEPDREGELWVRGRLFRAYIRSSGFDPGKDQDGWFHTGDRFVRRFDGRWSYRGRIRDVAKVKGESVWLGEIDVALEGHPAVRRAVAVVVDRDDDGDVIGCFAELKPDASIEAEDLLHHCRERMAPFKIPRRVVVAPAGVNWPVTVSGKVPRDEVRHLLEDELTEGQRSGHMTRKNARQLPSRPLYDMLPEIGDGSGARHAWDYFGRDDELGTVHFIDDDAVLRARDSIRTGQRIALTLPQDLPHPSLSVGRGPYEHHVEIRRSGRDDSVSTFYLQSSSQWDGLRHIRYKGSGYFGGRQESDLEGDHLGIDRMAVRGIVTRGVLVDVPAFRAARNQTIRCDTRDPVTVEEIEAVLEWEQVALEAGDVILLRTGWLGWYLGLGEAGRQHLRATLHNGEGGLECPGLESGTATAAWLWDQGIAAVAADNPAVEALKVESDRGFLHRFLIPLLGMPLGEFWYLEDLHQACEENAQYTFLLSAQPLRLPRAAGSPSNALAVL